MSLSDIVDAGIYLFLTIDLRQVRDASEDLDWRFGNSLSVEGISMVRVKIATLYDRLST
jgi:hypothetical protein